MKVLDIRQGNATEKITFRLEDGETAQDAQSIDGLEDCVVIEDDDTWCTLSGVFKMPDFFIGQEF